MRPSGTCSCVVLVFVAALISMPEAVFASEKVETMRVPHGGNAPQVCVDDQAVGHLIYFKASQGDRGDIFYVRSADGGAVVSQPIRVNSEPGSDVAGRPPRLADGRGGRAAGRWNGAPTAH